MYEAKTIEFAIKALIIKNGKFLAVHKANIKSDKYELPGGRMVFGETAEETVIREILEETGLKVKPIKLVDTWNYVINETNQITGVIYLCCVEEWVDIVLSEEHTDYKWFSPDMESLSKMNRLFRPQMETWDWGALLTYHWRYFDE